MLRILAWVRRHPLWTLILVVPILGVSAFYTFQLRVDNNIRNWLDRSDPGLVDYDLLLERFGHDVVVSVVFFGENLFAPSFLDSLARTAKELRDKPEWFEGSFSAGDVYEAWKRARLDADEPLALSPDKPDEAFKEFLTDSEMYRGMLTNATGSCVALNFTLTPAGNREYRLEVMKLVRGKAVSLAGKRTFYMVGQPVHGSELDRLSERVKKLYLGVILIAYVLLYFLCRDAFLALFGILSVAVTLLMTQAYAFHRGFSVNAITAAMPALLIVISLSNVIHLVVELRQRLARHGNGLRALEEANRHIAWPCFFNAFTTAVGFLSLFVSRLDPIRQLGELVCVGILLAYFNCLVVVNAGATLLRKRLEAKAEHATEEDTQSYFFERWAGAVIKARFAVLLLVVAGAFWGVDAVRRLKIESNPMEFFPEGNPFRTAYEVVEREFTGLSPFSIQLEGETSMLEADNLRRVEVLQEFLATDPETRSRVLGSWSAAEFIKETNRVARGGGKFNSFIPPDPEVLEEILARMPERLKTQMRKSFLSEDLLATRVAVQVKTLSSSEYETLLERVSKWIDSAFSGLYESKIIGIVPLISSAQGTILRSQIESFSLAGIVISIVFLFLLKNPMAVIVYMAACVFPILVTLGAMREWGISLNASTSTIACVAIGIAVDDCIHFHYRYREGLDHIGDRREAIRFALAHSGRAIWFTSIINILGFSALFFSGFMPTIYFGGLLAVAMLMALGGVLILLPALLLVFGIDREVEAERAVGR